MATTTLKNQEPAPVDLLKSQARVHLNYLDGLRALTALYVVLYHAVTWQVMHPTGLALKLTAWLLYGHFAVDIFIVISGFSLMLPVVRSDGSVRGGYWGFMRRRAKRILPPYYFALLCTTLLALTIISSASQTVWGMRLPVTLPAIVTHIFLLQDVVNKYFYSISAPFWSIAVEWQLYFVFPLLILAWNRFGGFRTIFGTLVISSFLLVVLRHTAFSGITPQYLALFSFGMLGATISYSREAFWEKMRLPLFWWPTLIITASASAFFCHLHNDYLVVQTHAGQADFLVGFTAMCFLVVSSLPGRNIVQKVLSWQPFVFVGTFAYSLYLIHYPLMQVVWQYVLGPYHLNFVQTLIGMILVSCPFSVAFAYLFFLVAEKPFLNTKPKPPVNQDPLAVEPPVVPA